MIGHLSVGSVILAHQGYAGHAALIVGVLAATAWFVHTRTYHWDAVVAWGGGTGAFLVASSPPFEALADRTFTGHMVQHLLLIVVAAPLLVVAMVRSRPLGGARRLPRWLRSRNIWLAPVAALAFVAVLVVTHLTGIYEAALRHRWIHELEHGSYLVVAVAVWAAMLAGATRARTVAPVGRILATFVLIGGTALLGVVLLSAPRALNDTYVDRLGATAALADQQAAGAIMWIGGMALTLPALVAAVWRWASAEEAIALRREQMLGSLVSRDDER